MEKERVYAFDFDGTLTRRDTFVEFIRYVFGTRRLLRGFLRFAPILVLMKLGHYPNWKAKQRLFAWFFKGMGIHEFDDYCRRFARDCRSIRRDDGFTIIRRALNEGSRVIVVSASIENWVRPFFDDFGGQVVVSCTKIDVREERVTGQFLTMNCYGIEKPKRILAAFPLRETYQLVAFGDSLGDKELLETADTGYFRSTRSGRLHLLRGEKDPMVEEVRHDFFYCQPTLTKIVGNKSLDEVLRFALVGITATLLQYGFYLLFLLCMLPALANTAAYLLSFAFNYIASTRYTFRVQPTKKRGMGFALSHLVNYTMQTVLLQAFLLIGIPQQWALIPVFCVCVPVNFLLVRFFLRK